VKPLLLLAVLLAGCSQKPSNVIVDPATISGVVTFTGTIAKPAHIDMDQDPACSKLYPGGGRDEEEVVVADNQALANAFVYIKTGLEGRQFTPPAQPARIDQKGCWFGPRVTGVMTGQSLEVTNSDPVTHNIHPQPKANREWNQSMAPEDGPIRRKFATPEVMIRVKCNVHKWMRAGSGVLPHPYYAVTGPDGKFTIPNLPPGRYTLVAWHEKLGTLEQVIDVAPQATVQLPMSFKGQ
jgi:hypothetical protein